MKTITYNGSIVDRPKLIHAPKIKHTIKPAINISFEQWSNALINEKFGKEVKDVELVKISIL